MTSQQFWYIKVNKKSREKKTTIINLRNGYGKHDKKICFVWGILLNRNCCEVVVNLLSAAWTSSWLHAFIDSIDQDRSSLKINDDLGDLD